MTLCRVRYTKFVPMYLTLRGPCIVIYSCNKGPTSCTSLQIHFDKVLYMFRTNLLSIIRSLNTVYPAKVICHASYGDCLLAYSQHN